jgi:hypothetical protein
VVLRCKEKSIERRKLVDEAVEIVVRMTLLFQGQPTITNISLRLLLFSISRIRVALIGDMRLWQFGAFGPWLGVTSRCHHRMSDVFWKSLMIVTRAL